MAKEKFITSSIGKKIIVGLTGLFLISFLVVHVGINSTILINDNGETYLRYTFRHYFIPASIVGNISGKCNFLNQKAGQLHGRRIFQKRVRVAVPVQIRSLSMTNYFRCFQ